MMNAWTLPTTLTVGGVPYKIRTNWRDVINILIAFNDPNLSKKEQLLTMLDILYEDFEILEDFGRLLIKAKDKYLSNPEVEEAMQKAVAFIDAGVENDDAPRARTMDWQHDAPLIFPSMNKMLGRDVRTEDMHWWTFLGYFMEIPDGTFLQVVNIRQKKSRGEKLEDYEKKFYRSNKNLIDLPIVETDEQRENRERLNKMLN